MALVASQDWPKNDMDNRQQRTHSTPPHNEQHQPQGQPLAFAPPQQQQQQHAQNPYAAYGQPQWGAMNMNMPNMAAMNHMNGHQPSPTYFPQMHYFPQGYPPPLQQQGHVPVQQQQQQGGYGNPPFYDPNAQFAHWAYQRMMFNAAQQQSGAPMQQQHPAPPQMSQPSQSQNRGRSGSHSTHSPTSTPTEYFAPTQLPFSHSNGSINGSVVGSGSNSSNNGSVRVPQTVTPPSQTPSPSTNNYQGFHPYRRPERGERDRQRTVDTTPSSSSMGGPNSVPFQPPYARQDAAGSTTSVNSTSSASQRSRTNSGNSASGSVRGANGTAKNTGSMRGVTSPYPNAHPPRIPSSSSTSQAAGGKTFTVSTTSASGSVSSSSASSMNSRTPRPSPLSQGSTFSTTSPAAERRKSRDDSDLAAMMSSQSLGSLGMEGAVGVNGHGPRSGLKGRLRRALSFNAAQTLKEEEEEEEAAIAAKGKKKERQGVLNDNDDADDGDASVMNKKKKKSIRLFNPRFNASTDNISLSSTVSSASVMIRKLGSMGKLARRNSLAGITSLFKDKNKEGDGDGSKKKAKGKASKAEASVSHVTAENERTSDEWSATGAEGLTPAMKLAREHTLRSNAEAATKTKVHQEVVSPSSSAPSGAQTATSDRNLTKGRAVNGIGKEDGVRVVVEDDSDEEGPVGRRSSDIIPDDGSGSDEESTWRGHGDEDEEDVTIRVGMGKVGFNDIGSSQGHSEELGGEECEPWAIDVRRSLERTKVPAKGILKNPGSYSQDNFLENPNPAFAQNRARANSYDSMPNQNSQAGPFARMPSPDPDHIDGLQKHHAAAAAAAGLPPSGTATPPFLPPLSFESSESETSLASTPSLSPPVPEKHTFFHHPNANSSEPALSTMLTSPPSLTHRSATSPAKRLAFASNLSIYDTFSPAVYDRSSEPATWSRLTPALAQRIKEELNSFKMEEMEVHSSSRIHTQFFV